MAAHGKGYQTERVVVNVTPEQAAAVDAAIQKQISFHEKYRQRNPKLNLPRLTQNDVLLNLLEGLCHDENVDWPEHVKAQGQRNDLKSPPNG